ncbi:hypothetical protein Ssi03_50970 [Sphaerisporangium siamense]|uniref:Uncharacterized protein n=1 Tax=Sphaerisporangium siamense TaxID=795645 RepID=A0A7W7D8Z4_9ACTN|nr:hypothetical protein [Sphaerisporangium siamense]MBB4702199.1 hypothetical protein [Sphaerisporangium siamense]GII87107.1 hypothetical protein Ssi03_50970 [Sphaerisporangium siamense]
MKRRQQKKAEKQRQAKVFARELRAAVEDYQPAEALRAIRERIGGAR